jgi:hypothetical protein
MNRDISLDVDPDEIVEQTINDNGQAYVGRDLGGKKVRLAIEVLDDTDD